MSEWMVVVVVREMDEWKFLMLLSGVEFLCQNIDFIGDLGMNTVHSLKIKCQSTQAHAQGDILIIRVDCLWNTHKKEACLWLHYSGALLCNYEAHLSSCLLCCLFQLFIFLVQIPYPAIPCQPIHITPRASRTLTVRSLLPLLFSVLPPPPELPGLTAAFLSVLSAGNIPVPTSSVRICSCFVSI